MYITHTRASPRTELVVSDFQDLRFASLDLVILVLLFLIHPPPLSVISYHTKLVSV